MDATGTDERTASEWWSDASFWEDAFDFIFPPEHLALGETVASQVEALLGLAAPARILDLGCGPGRVAVPLARHGHAVTGLDVQDGYLARARAWAARERVPLELRRADVSRLAYDDAFDAAISLFTSFGYFDDPADDRRVLEGARRALRRGGRFVLETAHRDGVVRLLRPRELRAADGRRFREDPAFDPVAGTLVTRWTVDAVAGPRRYTTRMRAYSATELDAMLRAAGFADVRFFGTLAGGSPSLDSWTITATAARPR
jgi:SAM-dependent methyltransferase